MNANDSLRQYTCTDNYYRHFHGILFTDGVKALCDLFKCYWLLDIVVSYQPQLKEADFQVWTITKRPDGTALVTCTDGNDGVLRAQEIEFTDFPADEATLWVEFGVVLLPSEH